MRVNKNYNSVFSFFFPVEKIVLRTPTPIEKLLIQKFEVNSEVAYHFSDDISLLLNQKRLENIGIDTVNHWLNSLMPVSDSLSELRSKCSDADLLSLVKSRHIQSSSELLAWSDYLNSHYDQLSSAAKEIVSARKSDDNVVESDDNVVKSEGNTES